MMALVERLFPLCRSITGDGVRQTLAVLDDLMPLRVHEVPSGTEVLDWTVPLEWNIRDAYVTDENGRRVIDFAESNLHVVGYSEPVQETMTLQELRPHLHSLPDQPDLIPYRTSYYKPDWGFCVSQNALDDMQDGRYSVVIDSSLTNGSLTYAEHVVAGTTTDEVLLSCHTCHPSLANDNLAAMAVAVELGRRLSATTPRYTYRFLFSPGTIGAITWLARNVQVVPNVKHGLVLACAGDSGALTYKRSRRGDAQIDKVVEYVLETSGRPHSVLDFSPYGYDERQFCSPGFNMAVGSLTRTPYGKYPEYHTSGDNVDFISAVAMEDTLETLWDVVSTLENNRRYVNLSPYGEPQLGRRGLYDHLGGRSDTKQTQMAMLWVLNLSDGNNTLLDICGRADMSLAAICSAADALHRAGLLKE